MAEPTNTSAIDALTNLPKTLDTSKSVAPDPTSSTPITDSPAITSMFKDMGVAAAETPQGYGTNPLTTATKTVDLTNTYTDPLSSYLEYKVPMNPYFNFNDVRAQNQSTAEKWVRGLTKAGVTAFGAVVENSLGTLAGIGEVASGGSFYDNSVGRNVDKMNNFMQEYMPNYYTEKEQNMGLMESMGTANFWADKVANGVGYSLGSIATMMLGSGEVGLLAQGAKYGVRGLGALTVKAVKLGDKLEDGFKLTNMYRAGKIIETGKRADQALDIAAKFARLEKASQRLAVATNMSFAESSVEAREAQKTFIENKIAEWENANPGQEMPADVEEGINESARAVGNLTFAINLPITSLTNIAMFGKMMKGAAVGEKAINELESKSVKDSVIRTFEEAGTESANKYIKAWNKASNTFKPSLLNSLEEATQEGSQFAASELSKNYYGDKFDNGVGDMSKALSESMSATFGTKEGLENILIGAIIGGGTGTVQSLAGAEKKLREAKTANTQSALEILTSGGLANPLANLEDANAFTSTVNKMNAAAASGDNLTADRHRKGLIASVAMRLDRLGGLEYGLEQLEDAKGLSEEEFKKAFGYDVDKSLASQTGGMSVSEVVDDVKSTIENTIKRKNDVKDLVQKYTPGEGLISRMLASMGETEDSKYRKALATEVEQKYLKAFSLAAVDLDTLDSQIDKSIESLFESMNPLGDPGSLDINMSKQDFAAYVKNGTITLDDEGNINIDPISRAKLSNKTLDKLEDITKVFKSLGHVLDQEKVNKNMIQVSQLIAKRDGAANAINNLMKSPESRDMFMEAMMLKEQAEAKKKANNTAQAIIDSAETSDDIRNNFPDDASLELRAAASAAIEELEAKEEQALKDFSGMSLEELEKINEDEQSPINLKALLAAKQQKLEKVAFENNNNLGQPQNIGTGTNAPNMFQAEEEVLEALSEIEKATIGEIRVSANNGSIGSVFTIQGREYINPFGDKTEAIIRDNEGNIVGVKLLDKVTGNFVTWNVRDYTTEYSEQAETETAIVDAIAYAILLNEASIRSDQTITQSEAKEANDARVEAVTEDFNKVQTVEDSNTVSMEDTNKDPIANLNRTKEMSDAELRMQIETLKQDLIEIDETIDALAQLAKEAGFSKKEFNQDGQVIQLKKIKKTIARYISAKIKELQSRKASNKTAKEQTENAELQPDEITTLKNTINAEIETLNDKIKEQEVLKKSYEDIVSGVYGENQNTEEAQAEIKKINKKIGALKAQITKRLSKLDALTPTQNETREIEQSIENSNSPEGPTSPTEGEVTQDTDLDPGTPSQEIRLDAGIELNEAEQLELLRQQAEQDLADLALYGTEEVPEPENIPEPSVVVEEAGLSDVRLIKGQFETDPDFKVIVDANGNPVSNVIYDPIAKTFQPLVINVNGEILALNPQLLSDPEIAKAGSRVKFKVLDNSEYWNSVKDSIDPNDHWKTVPIMVYVEINGVETPITLLQAYTESATDGEKGASRKDIVNLHNKGLTPVATVSSKRFQLGPKGNIVNTVTQDGQRFFSPISALGANVEFAVVGKLGFKYNGSNSSIASYLENKPTAGFINGQVVTVITDPNGEKQILALSTKDMTTAGATAATKAIIENNPNKFTAIVGVSSDTETDESTNFEDPNLLIVDILPTGEAFFKFYDTTNKSLIKVDLDNLRKALLGEPYKFSFVTPSFEDGNVAYQSVVRPEADYATVDVKDIFEKAIESKKYQVDVNQPLNQPYTSPITGKTYPTYIEYLSSNENFTGEPVTQGTSAILRTDSFADPFFDIGLKFEDLGVEEKVDVKTKEEVATNNVVIPTAPTTPVSTNNNVERIEIPRYFTFGELGGKPGARPGETIESEKNAEIQKNLKEQLQEGDKLIEPNGDIFYYKNGIVVKPNGQPRGFSDVGAFVNGVTIERTKNVSTDAKADIERRRKEALESISGDYLGQTFLTYTADAEDINGDIENIISTDENEIKNKIKAKYDAELAALEGGVSTGTKINLSLNELNENANLTREAYTKSVLEQVGLKFKEFYFDYTAEEFLNSKLYKDNKNLIDERIEGWGINKDDIYEFELIPSFYNGLPSIQISVKHTKYDGLISLGSASNINLDDKSIKLGEEMESVSNNFRNARSLNQNTQHVSQPAGPRILPKSLVVTDPEILKQLSEEVDMINEIPTEGMPTSFEDFEQEVSGGSTDLNDLMNTLVPDPNVTPTPATSTYVNAGKGENSIETKTTSSKFARGNRSGNTVDPNQANTEGSNTKC